MSGYSRRQLAKYAADELQAGRSARQLAQQLAAVLAGSSRGKQADLLIADIYRELEDRGLVARAVVSTAYPLNASQESKLETALKRAVAVDKILIDKIVDPSLLGGVKIQTANRQWDNTVRNRLKAIKEAV